MLSFTKQSRAATYLTIGLLQFASFPTSASTGKSSLPTMALPKSIPTNAISIMPKNNFVPSSEQSPTAIPDSALPKTVDGKDLFLTNLSNNPEFNVDATRALNSALLNIALFDRQFYSELMSGKICRFSLKQERSALALDTGIVSSPVTNNTNGIHFSFKYIPILNEKGHKSFIYTLDIEGDLPALNSAVASYYVLACVVEKQLNEKFAGAVQVEGLSLESAEHSKTRQLKHRMLEIVGMFKDWYCKKFPGEEADAVVQAHEKLSREISKQWGPK